MIRWVASEKNRKIDFRKNFVFRYVCFLFELIYALSVIASYVESQSLHNSEKLKRDEAIFTQSPLKNDTFRRNSFSPFLNQDYAYFQDRTYDAIVIGGGGAGCPFARTLAEVGLRVLLIERGGSRLENPLTLDTHGVGKGLNDPSNSQLLITSEGVRSHIANVLSGGTGLNIGIFIFETDEYLELLESIPGVIIRRDIFHKAMNWTAGVLAHMSQKVKPLFYEDVWKEALQSFIGPFINNSLTLHVNRTWQSFSLFDDTNNGYRHATDLTLGPPQKEFPKTLDVLIHHMVEKIEFNKSRATCVIVHPTKLADVSPLVGSKLHNTTTWLHRFLDATHLINKFSIPKSSVAHEESKAKFRVCVNSRGVIVSSAGALLTPLLLFKSGIGPAEAVKNAGAPLLYEQRQLGRNLKDRLFLPFALFASNKSGDDTEFGFFQPRVSHAVGLASLLAFEVLSGSAASSGIMLATRYVIPPGLRHTLIADLFFSTLKRCEGLQKPFEGKLNDAGCMIVWPILQCLRRSLAGYVFSGEVRSQGFITLEKDGTPYIEGGYLKDDTDHEALIHGVRLLNNIVKELHEKSTQLEPASQYSCPSIIFNTLIQFIENQFLKKHFVEDIQNSTSSMTDFLDAKRLLAWSHHYLKIFRDSSEHTVQTPRFSFLTPFYRKLFRLPWSSLKKQKSHFPATFPMTSPVGHQEKSIKEWTRSFSTSLWHWIGSAGLGIVVDNEFRVKGFDNLLIVDASVLTNITRMNPMATLVSLSRYAGILTRERLLALSN